MKTLAVLLPTRNKPEELIRILGEIEATKTLETTRLYAYVANDDPKLAEYKNIRMEYPLHMTIGEPLGFSRAQNYLAQAAIEGGADMVMRCEDDFYFEIEGWDKAYLDALPADGIGLVWCNYKLKGPEAEPHTGAVGKEWVQALGYFSLPGLIHYCCDNVLADLATPIGRKIYLETPYIVHKHNRLDERKKEGFPTNERLQEDVKIYKKWGEEGGWKSDVEKLHAKT